MSGSRSSATGIAGSSGRGSTVAGGRRTLLRIPAAGCFHTANVGFAGPCGGYRARFDHRSHGYTRIMRVLGINAIFHDPSAALVVDGRVVAAAEEERFSRRKHGKRPVPFSAWELPEQSAAWCLSFAGIDASQLDAVAYSFDPTLCRPADSLGLDDPWDWLRQEYASRAPGFLADALPGLDPAMVRFVPPHVAHAASAALAAPADQGHGDCAVLVLDGRGEVSSHLSGVYRDGALDPLHTQALPHSLGLMYEELTAHLGFLRSSDEYKVMALASYGKPRFLPELREMVYATGDGGFRVNPIDLATLTKPVAKGADLGAEHADLACSIQTRLEEVILDLARWLHEASGGMRHAALAGGRRRRHRARRRPARRARPRRGDGAHADGRARPRLQRRRDRGRAAPRPPALHAPRLDRRGGRRGARAQRHRRVVPGAQRVLPPGARAPLAAGQRDRPRQHRAAQPGQGARAVPPGRTDGPGGTGRRAVRRAPGQPVHALRAA